MTAFIVVGALVLVYFGACVAAWVATLGNPRPRPAPTPPLRPDLRVVDGAPELPHRCERCRTTSTNTPTGAWDYTSGTRLCGQCERERVIADVDISAQAKAALHRHGPLDLYDL